MAAGSKRSPATRLLHEKGGWRTSASHRCAQPRRDEFRHGSPRPSEKPLPPREPLEPSSTMGRTSEDCAPVLYLAVQHVSSIRLGAAALTPASRCATGGLIERQLVIIRQPRSILGPSCFPSGVFTRAVYGVQSTPEQGNMGKMGIVPIQLTSMLSADTVKSKQSGY